MLARQIQALGRQSLLQMPGPQRILVAGPHPVLMQLVGQILNLVMRM
jgi:hypothetical protein